jgi:predicted RNA-binding protein with PUA-like domain
MRRQYWLVKQEPQAYSWDDFVKDKGTAWTGVRNYQARNNLRAMRKDDLVAFYHSVSEKSVVGIAQVTKTAYPDPTADEGDWSCVDLAPVSPLNSPVHLDQIKVDSKLKDISLVRQSRLSVLPLTAVEFKHLLSLGQTKLP